ncbi:hypothetical protein [Natrialba aegyptia]|uniref:hypothetical protein n=1 Tax=Natrialba aegyptia TaxID=129789 RepID=UPI000AFA9CE0|nr:hypothetical protein [Natrialba aegyptia]
MASRGQAGADDARGSDGTGQLFRVSDDHFDSSSAASEMSVPFRSGPRFHRPSIRDPDDRLETCGYLHRAR